MAYSNDNEALIESGANAVIRKNLKDIRTRAGKTQQQVADALHVSRSVYTRYETGQLQPKQDFLFQFSKLFSVPMDILAKSVSAVIPDTSALLQNRRLLGMLLLDFDQVIIMDTVLRELDYQKDHGTNRKNAWQAMMTINDFRLRYKDRILIVEYTGPDDLRNDGKIIHMAAKLNKAQGKRMFVIHNDIGITLTYPDALLLRDYIARRTRNTDYEAILDLDTEFRDFSRFESKEMDLNAYLPDGSTLLISCLRCNDKAHLEARGGQKIDHPDIMRKMDYLLRRGADPDRTDNSSYCLTPLSHCVQLGDYEAFQALLAAGADYNKGSVDELSPGYLKQQNVNEGNTPLMIACWHGRTAFVKHLLSLDGICLNQQDSNGYTALMKCAVQRYSRSQKHQTSPIQEHLYALLLQQPGIDVRIRDRNNRTAADWWYMGDTAQKGGPHDR